VVGCMTMPTRAPDTVRVSWATMATSVVFTVLPLIAFLWGNPRVVTVVVIAFATTGAVYAVSVHPFSIFVALAVVLGVAPYMHIPGTPIPMLLALAASVWVALAFLPGLDTRPGWCELWIVVLALLALMSVLASDPSGRAFVEYAAWIVATAVVVPVRLLPAERRATMVRAFVVSSAVGSVLGVLIRSGAPRGLLEVLSSVGYNPGRNVQYVFGLESATERLSGTFLEPNIAGLILAAGLLLAVAYFRGTIRVILVLVIGSGLLLTLSRASIATAVVAAVLVVLRSPARRASVFGAGLLAVFVALAIPIVRTRLLGSFGPNDFGAVARQLALREFPQTMQGHWVWGLGWDREEFRSRSVGQIVNYVANGPLVTIYRGGIVLGAVVIVLLVVLVLRSWLAAHRSFEDAVVCCAVIGFILVAMQLDFPIVLQAPATTVFSFLVALSLAPMAPDPIPGRSSRA
jgi:polysaccharide biosynthesis protein PslJ